MTTPEATTSELASALHLARWTINSGSHVISRGAVVIASGDHQWEAAAEGNGPIDALFRAVDRALNDVLAEGKGLFQLRTRAWKLFNHHTGSLGLKFLTQPVQLPASTWRT